jgi:hypothetical protein
MLRIDETTDIGTVYARIGANDLCVIRLESGILYYVTLNTSLYYQLTKRRICRNMKLEKIARENNRLRAYFPELKSWGEIPLYMIEFVRDSNHYNVFH